MYMQPANKFAAQWDDVINNHIAICGFRIDHFYQFSISPFRKRCFPICSCASGTCAIDCDMLYFISFFPSP